MKRDSLFFKISCASYCVSALSVLLAFLGDYKGNGAAVFFAVLTGVLFWGGIIAGTVLLVLVNNHRRKNFSTPKDRRTDWRRFGILNFFSNRIAQVIDIAMGAFFVLFLVSMFIPAVSQNISLVLFSLLLLSAFMHSMFNGVNYIYIIHINEERRK